MTLAPIVLAAALAATGPSLGAEVRPDSGLSGINARSAVVLSFRDGLVLWSKNPDAPIPPASVAKLVTLYVAYEAIAAGEIGKDSVIVPLESECEPNLPYRSSLMYLRPGMRVTVLDLMRGLAVASGNDAALVLARAVAGSTEAFAERMNRAVASLGLSSMHFVEPSGLSELNMVTARELALFARAYLERHPEALGELHSLTSFEFPRASNMPPGVKPSPDSTYLSSRNALLGGYEGCDGLKTGYIDQSGYNFAVTAKRGSTRLIVVTLGGSGRDSTEGGENRVRDAKRLLDWGFGGYVTASLPLPEIPSVRLWKCAQGSIRPVPAEDLAVTVPKDKAGKLAVRVETDAEKIGPVAKGDILGTITVTADGSIVRKIRLVAERAVGKAGLLVRILHSIALFFLKLFSRGS